MLSQYLFVLLIYRAKQFKVYKGLQQWQRPLVELFINVHYLSFLGEVINWAKGLIAKVDTQIGCAAAVPERSGGANG